MLYPGRPGAEVITAIMTVGWASAVALLLGVWTRAAHVVAAIAAMAVGAYAVSGEQTWSHGDVPTVLALLALLGARSGDALSIDAWWRARRGRPAVRTSYQAGVRLVQFAIAAMFGFAAYEKIKAGGPTLAWALSDSFRHHLVAWYDGSGSPRTPVADWLLGAAWRYELGACASLFCQLAPLCAVIFVRRPWLRALVGAMWCSEVVGLGLVMNLWNLHWLPLAAAFIDWDALAARFGARGEAGPPARSRGRLAFATGFVVVFCVQALWLNQRLHAYPFSAFPLFAQIRAKRPYDRHQTYEFAGARLEAIGAASGDPAIEGWLAVRASFRVVVRARQPREVSRVLGVELDNARRAWPRAEFTGMRHWLSVFQVPAYPAPARLDRVDLAVVGELDRGAFRSALGTLSPDQRTWIAPAEPPPLAGMSLFAVRGDAPDPVAVAATTTPTGFVLATPLVGDPVYLIGRPAGGGPPWLLAVRSRRGY
jgi:hypothetical protein